MIKLTNIYHEFNNIGVKPNDQFQKKRIDSTKIPNVKSFENPIKMHEIMHEIMKIKTKEGVKRSYRPWERKTLQRIWLKTTKKSLVEPCQVGEREESLKKF